MDSNKSAHPNNQSDVQMKNIGTKISDNEDAHVTNKNMSSLLNDIGHNQHQAVITIKEKDIECLVNELAITYDQAKTMLIKNQGDLKSAINYFLLN